MKMTRMTNAEKQMRIKAAFDRLPQDKKSWLLTNASIGEYFWYDVEKYFDKMSEVEKSIYGIDFTHQKITRKR